MARLNSSTSVNSEQASLPATPEKFETLLQRLDQVVSEMERSDLPLEQVLANYEEGMRLVKACGERLSEAEQKIFILSQEASGGGSVESGASLKKPGSFSPTDDRRVDQEDEEIIL